MKNILLLFVLSITFSFSSPNSLDYDNCVCTGVNGFKVADGYPINTSAMAADAGTWNTSITETVSSTCTAGNYRLLIIYNYTYRAHATKAGYTYKDWTKFDIRENCITCNETDVAFPESDTNATYPLSWSETSPDAPAITSQCIMDLGGTVETAKTKCVNLYRCKVPDIVPEACENKQLIRDTNGTCVCPDGGETYNGQYSTCLSEGACPSEPTTTIYTNGICYRWFYDCVGFDKATETHGLTSDQCRNPTDPANDTDGDGIPDALDDDMDGDGIPNNSDPDIDGDGVPNSSDPDSNRGPETNSTAPSEDICKLQDPNSYRNGNQCSCNTGYTMTEGVCKKPDSPTDPCNYPSEKNNYDFQGLTLNRSSCVDQYTYWSNNRTGITAKLETCEKYGCYYNTGAKIGDTNVSNTSNGTGADLDGDGESDLADGNGETGDGNELNKEDAGVLGELIGDALSNINVGDVLVVNASGPPPPSKVTIMGEQYTLFDANKIPSHIWETVQTIFKFMAIISGVITVFMSI